MNGSNNLLSMVTKLAEANRQLHDIELLVEHTADTVKRFWFLAPLLAAGWSYMVADEERYQMLQAIGNQVLDAVPVESWLGMG
jgi:hypothetical protein